MLCCKGSRNHGVQEKVGVQVRKVVGGCRDAVEHDDAIVTISYLYSGTDELKLQNSTRGQIISIRSFHAQPSNIGPEDLARYTCRVF
jgi:hypothetical protein